MHYVKVSRLYNSAKDKLSTKHRINSDSLSTKRIRKYWKKDKLQYSKLSNDDMIKYMEKTFSLLNTMFPFHMPNLKIENKISDGKYIATVHLRIPFEQVHEKDGSISYIDDYDTPHRELNALTRFIMTFITPNVEHDESTIIDKIPSRTILKEFVRLYAPYTTKDKMVNLLKKLRVNETTIRVYVNSDSTINFNRDETELFLTIFDNYIMRNGINKIKFKDIEKHIRVISVEDLFKMDDQGRIKLPYKVDRERKLFCRIM